MANDSAVTTLLKVTSKTLDAEDDKNICKLTFLGMLATSVQFDQQILIKRCDLTLDIS